jgi:YVTN family beta-propeller protein
MSLRRVSQLAAVILCTFLWMSCGNIYRPVVIPINLTPPNSANFHSVMALTSNGSFEPVAPNLPQTFSYSVGTAIEIDVSGDTIIGETGTNPGTANIGINPTHASILSNGSKVFVVSAGSVVPGGVDLVSAFVPASSSSVISGLGALTAISLPAGSLPDFVTSSVQANSAYVANFGTNSISEINLNTNAVIDTVPTGTGPVAMSAAVTPEGTKLYVANQTSNSVTSFNAQDMSQNTVTGFTGITPVWTAARADGQKLYVVTQGDGQLVTFNTATDSVASSFSVGAGANYIYYEPNSQRIYVTNPATSTLYILSASGGAGDTPTLLQTIYIGGAATTGNYPSCLNPCPVSVAALPDGTRAYVGSYALTSCSDPTFSTSCLVTPQVTVIDTMANTVKTTIYPLSLAQSGATPSSVSESFDCMPSIPYTPAGVPVPGTSTVGFSTRFRVPAAVASDSSRAFVGVCDAGAIAVIDTTTSSISYGGSNTPDTLIADIAAPFGVCSQSTCNPATITSFSISSNVVIFQAANNFVPGQSVAISGLSTGTYLDGQNLTVLATGLSTSQFECSFTHADVSATPDSGSAVPIPPTQNPIFLFTGQ